MKLRTSAATALAATAAVLAMGAAPAMAAGHTTAALAKPSLTLSASTTWATYGHWVTLTAHLGKTAANHTVEIDGADWGGGSWVLKKANVDRNGNLVAYAKMGHNTTFTAKFAGDSKDAATSTKKVVYSAAVVNAAMVGQAYNSGGYAVYHAGQNPTIKGTVSPNKTGEAIWITVQAYYSGSWHTVSLQHQYFNLGAGSSFDVYLTGVPAGAVIREAMTFRGDGWNTGSGTTWHYAKVVK